MPVADPPLPPIPAVPDLPVTSSPTALLADAALAESQVEPSAPPRWSPQVAAATRPWFKQTEVVVERPAAEPVVVPVLTPTTAPQTHVISPGSWTPPPYPHPPRGAGSDDPVERALALLDRIHHGRYLREFAGDILTELLAVRDVLRDEIATRPKKAA